MVISEDGVSVGAISGGCAKKGIDRTLYDLYKTLCNPAGTTCILQQDINGQVYP